MPRPPVRTVPKAAPGTLHEAELAADDEEKKIAAAAAAKEEKEKETPPPLTKPQSAMDMSGWAKAARPLDPMKRQSTFGFLSTSATEKQAIQKVSDDRRASMFMGSRRTPLIDPEPAKQPPLEQAIVRVFAADGTFRSVVVTSQSTASECKDLVIAKMKKMAEYANMNFTECVLFETLNNRDERELGQNELVLELTKKWTNNASKLILKDKAAPKKAPSKEIVRVYFSDYTFKTFAVDAATTVKEFCAQINRKMRFPDVEPYSLWETSDTTDSRRLKDDDVVVVVKESAEEAVIQMKFVFSNTKPQSYQQFITEERARLEKEANQAKRASVVDYDSSPAGSRESIVSSGEYRASIFAGGDSRALLAQAMKNSSPTQVKSREERSHNEKMQVKAFTAWVNYHLSKRGLCVENLRTDFASGVMLINLLEILSGESLGRYQKQPKVLIQQMENINLALKWAQNKGVPNNSVSSEDLIDGNIKMILSLLWPIIVASYTGEIVYVDELAAKNDLLSWCKECIEESGKNIPYPVDNFDSCWRDGKLVCLLLSSYYSEVFDYDQLARSPSCLKETLSLAEKELQIPPVIAEEDMDLCRQKDWKPDDRSVFCLVAVVYDVLRLCCTPSS